MTPAQLWPVCLSGTVRRIHNEGNCALLHTKYKRFGPCGFREVFYIIFFLIVSILELMPLPAGYKWHDVCRASHSIATYITYKLGFVWLAGFITRITMICYIQIIKALCLEV